jgi:hypothetical protein
MTIRSLWVPTMVFAIGCAAPSEAASPDGISTEQPTAEQSGVEQAATGSAALTGFQCLNKGSVQVACVGQVAVLPINVNIKDVHVLTNNQILLLTNDLNNISVLDAGILNGNDILDDVKATILDDFLNLFQIPVTDNVVNVCTNPLGIQFCK